MNRCLVGHRADDGVLVRQLGASRQMLGYAHAGNTGGDLFELTPQLRFRVRLRIESIHLAHAAGEKQMNDGDIVAALRLRHGALLQNISHRDPAERGKRTDFDE